MAGEYAGHAIGVDGSGNLVGVIRRIAGLEVHEDQITAQRTAENALGASAVTGGATITLVTTTVPASPAVYRLWGFRVWTLGIGEPTDCKAWLEVGGIEIHADELHIARRIAEVRLPLPEPIANGAVVSLKVFNRGTSTTFVGKILGE